MATQSITASDNSVEVQLQNLGLNRVALDNILRKSKSTVSSYIYNVEKYLTWYEKKHEPFIERHGDESVQSYCLFLLNDGNQPSSLWSMTSHVKENLSSVFGCNQKGWHLTTQFCKRSSNGFEPKLAKT